MTNNSAIASQEQTGVFERQEKKFLIQETLLEAFLSEIHSHLTPDERGATRVSSLYYDTPENTLISRSLEKPTYKEKLRIRAYGQVSHDSEVFVELKKKFKGIVYKRRFACSLKEAYEFMAGQDVKSDTVVSAREAMSDTISTGQNDKSDTTVFERNYVEVKACRDRYAGLMPKMLIVTNRLALYSNDGSDIRMTIDFKPCFDDENLHLEGRARHKNLIDDEMCILEVKCAGSLPMWLATTMSEMEIRPQSFSKYGHAFKKCFQKNNCFVKSNVSGHAPKHATYKEVACV